MNYYEKQSSSRLLEDMHLSENECLVFIFSRRISYFRRYQLSPLEKYRWGFTKFARTNEDLNLIYPTLMKIEWHKPVFYFAKLKLADLSGINNSLHTASTYEDLMSKSAWSKTTFFEPIDGEITRYPPE